jgi:hypothetical protein
MIKKKLKEFVVEIKKNKRWQYKSDHKWKEYAEAVASSVPKNISVRIKQNGKVIFTEEALHD